MFKPQSPNTPAHLRLQTREELAHIERKVYEAAAAEAKKRKEEAASVSNSFPSSS